LAYIPLSADRGFAVCGISKSRPYRIFSDPTCPSILSIDFDNGTYKLIDSRVSKSRFAYWNKISRPTFDTIMFIGYRETQIQEGNRLNVYKLNASLSKIEHTKCMDISLNDRFFHIIDGIIVFADIRHWHLVRTKVVTSLMYIDEKDNFVKIENSAALLRAHSSSNIGRFFEVSFYLAFIFHF
jgi:hypothetical protein